jgi:hypothetical protein
MNPSTQKRVVFSRSLWATRLRLRTLYRHCGAGQAERTSLVTLQVSTMRLRSPFIGPPSQRAWDQPSRNWGCPGTAIFGRLHR